MSPSPTQAQGLEAAGAALGSKDEEAAWLCAAGPFLGAEQVGAPLCWHWWRMRYVSVLVWWVLAFGCPSLCGPKLQRHGLRYASPAGKPAADLSRARAQGMTPSSAALAALQAAWPQNGLSPASSEDAPAQATPDPGLGGPWCAMSSTSPARAGAGEWERERGAQQGFERFTFLNPAQPQLHAIAAAPACGNPFSDPAAWGSQASSRHMASPDCGSSAGPGDRPGSRLGDLGYGAGEPPQVLAEGSCTGGVTGLAPGCRSAPAALAHGAGLPQARTDRTFSTQLKSFCCSHFKAYGVGMVCSAYASSCPCLL